MRTRRMQEASEPVEIPDQRDDERSREIEQLRSSLQFAQNELEQIRQSEFDFEVEEPLVTLSFCDRPELFLLSEIFVLSTKAGLFIFLEDLGASVPIEGGFSDLVFGAATIWMLVEWVRAEWAKNEWLLVPRGSLVLLGIIVAVYIFSGHGAWDGQMNPPTLEHTLLAYFISVGALAISASTYHRHALSKTLNFLTHPIKTIRRLFK